jgi:hypothetical protein
MVSGLRSGRVELGGPPYFGLGCPTISMSGVSSAGMRCGAVSEKIDHFKIDSMDISDARSSTPADGGALSEWETVGVFGPSWTIPLTAGESQLADPVLEPSYVLEVAMCSWGA